MVIRALGEAGRGGCGSGPDGDGPAEPQAGRGTAGSGNVRPAVVAVVMASLGQMAMVMEEVEGAVGDGDA